ncbi:MAG: hypothetical protein MH252_00405 [Thermosynechococcaceae cyanobacterium MS004]|nr:hypothetical protein [Thermosynechococcaceae cyanobacterium MS004]
MQGTDIDNASPSIDLMAATTAAIEFLMATKDKIDSSFSDIRLEEVERSSDGDRWLITLGYNIQISKGEARANLGSQLAISQIISDITDTVKREYKVFEVNAQTGRVESMKIRAV